MPDVLIIGAGPAGLAAALQLRRRGVDFRIFEHQRVGGLLNNANWVENYPGFPGGISGEALVERFHQQVTELGVEIVNEEVHCLDYAAGQFQAKTAQGIYQAPVAIIASGTLGNTLEGIIPPLTLRRRVLTEILPIKGMTGQRVVIVGAGDLAFDYAMNLGRSNDVLILNRSQQVKCLPLLWERAGHLPGIQYREQTQLAAIQAGEAGGLSLIIESPGGSQVIDCDYLVYAIGRRPNTGFLSPHALQIIDELEQSGALFRIGDVKRGIYRQTTIAVGDGILAAMQIIQNWEGKSA